MESATARLLSPGPVYTTGLTGFISVFSSQRHIATSNRLKVQHLMNKEPEKITLNQLPPPVKSNSAIAAKITYYTCSQQPSNAMHGIMKPEYLAEAFMKITRLQRITKNCGRIHFYNTSTTRGIELTKF